MQISDEELEGYEDAYGAFEPERRQEEPQLPGPPGALPLYSLSLVQPPSNGTGFFSKKLGPLPVWGWGLLTAVVGGAGYAYWRVKKAEVKSNPDGDEKETSSRDEEDDEPSQRGGWSPSRSRFGDQLKKYLTRKGVAEKCKVYVDADDAKKVLKKEFVSPLVTMKAEGFKAGDKAFVGFCKKEGLSPIAHEGGVIGFYPTESKRGKEWEEYIDALRDDGQTV